VVCRGRGHTAPWPRAKGAGEVGVVEKADKMSTESRLIGGFY
jgi:hypothetical protein